MKTQLCAVLVVLSCMSANVVGHDLAAALQGLLTTGQTMRLVYQKGGPPCQNNGYGGFSALNPNVGIYRVSSTDGVISKLYPSGSGTGNYHCVHISYDGNRVIFFDFDANEVVVVNYATGAEVKRFATSNNMLMYDYWFNSADGTEWAITCNDNSVTKYNIATGSAASTPVLSSLSNYCQVSDAATLTISDNGEKLLLCRNDRATLLTLVGGTTVTGQEGCWYMMRSGVNSSGKVEFSQNGTSLTGHRGPTIIDDAGSVKGTVRVSEAVETWLGSNSGMNLPSCTNVPNGPHCADGLRWLRNRDYFSVTVHSVKIGPVLWRTTDNKWTYIEENLGCEYAGDMDGIVSSSFTDAIQRPEVRPTGKILATGAARTYSLQGRLSGGGDQKARQGIMVHQTKNGAARLIYR